MEGPGGWGSGRPSHRCARNSACFVPRVSSGFRKIGLRSGDRGLFDRLRESSLVQPVLDLAYWLSTQRALLGQRLSNPHHRRPFFAIIDPRYTGSLLTAGTPWADRRSVRQAGFPSVGQSVCTVDYTGKQERPSMRRWGCRSGCFDTACISQMVHHLASAFGKAIVVELERVLKAGGSILSV